MDAVITVHHFAKQFLIGFMSILAPLYGPDEAREGLYFVV